MSDETYDNWLALLSPSQRRHRGRLSAKLTRGDDGGASRPSSYRCNVEEPEKPIAAPTLVQHWDISAPKHSAKQRDRVLFEIFLVLASIRLDVFEECFFDRCRQHRVAVFVALACANHNFVARKIYIFDSKATTFHQAEARATPSMSPICLCKISW